MSLMEASKIKLSIVVWISFKRTMTTSVGFGTDGLGYFYFFYSSFMVAASYPYLSLVSNGFF